MKFYESTYLNISLLTINVIAKLSVHKGK